MAALPWGHTQPWEELSYSCAPFYINTVKYSYNKLQENMDIGSLQPWLYTFGEINHVNSA